MSILKKGWNRLKKSAQKTVRKALSGVTDNKRPEVAAPMAQLGPAGDTGARATTRMAADRNRRRAARGRDSTIITSRTEIGSRTLLG